MNADIEPALKRIQELEAEAAQTRNSLYLAEAKYLDDMEAACKLVGEADLPVGEMRAETFPELMELVLRYTDDVRGRLSAAINLDW